MTGIQFILQSSRNPSFHIHEEFRDFHHPCHLQKFKNPHSSKDILTPTFQKKFDDLQKEGYKIKRIKAKTIGSDFFLLEEIIC